MYDVIIIGAGPGGIFSAYELMKQDENLKIAVFDAGHSLDSANGHRRQVLSYRHLVLQS